MLKRLYHIAKSQSFVPISDDPYSTHLPYLVGLNHLYEFRSIVEFGSGFHSTLSFLNKDIFSRVESVIAYENFKVWFDKVGDVLPKDDPRISYKFVGGSICHHVSPDEITHSDVVFIDDSVSASDRSETLNKVLKCSPKLVIVHDFENLRYRFVANRSRIQSYRCRSLLPNVGVIGSEFDLVDIRKLDDIVFRYKDDVDHTDLYGWSSIFKDNLNVQ